MTDSKDPSGTLAEALPREMARVRDEVLAVYLTLGPGGVPASVMMKADLDGAAKALAEGDVVEMMRRYESLKGWQVA
jgi:hypothetical protein